MKRTVVILQVVLWSLAGVVGFGQTTVFQADFEASAVESPTAVGNLNIGTATGAWTINAGDVYNLLADAGATAKALHVGQGSTGFDLLAGFTAPLKLASNATVTFQVARQLGTASGNGRRFYLVGEDDLGNPCFDLQVWCNNANAEFGPGSLAWNNAGTYTTNFNGAASSQNDIQRLNSTTTYNPSLMGTIKVDLFPSHYVVTFDRGADGNTDWVSGNLPYNGSPALISRIHFYGTTGNAVCWLDNVAATGVPLAPARFLWRGGVNANWDINTTENWINQANGFDTVYTEGTPDGDFVTLDDSALVFNVNLPVTVQPTTITFNNLANPYTLGGNGQIGGGAAISVAGGGAVTLNGVNSYAGGTYVANGTLKLAGASAFGSGPINLAGGSLSSDGLTARTVTNEVILSANSTLGDPVNNGRVTLAGPVTFGSTTYLLNIVSDVTISGPSGSGYFDKTGPGTLTVTGDGNWMDGNGVDVREGVLIIEGATITDGAAFRVSATSDNTAARIVLTNGGSVTIVSSGSNYKVGDSTGNPTATNYLDIDGTIFATVAGTYLQMGQSGAHNEVNLLPNGLLEVRDVRYGNTGTAFFNFRGGTFRATQSANNFMQDLTAAYVHAGGAKIDSGSNEVVMLQNLEAPPAPDLSGGLTKLGTGSLTLSGTLYSYTGPTVVSEGSLALPAASYSGGGAFTVADSAALSVDLAGGAATLNASTLTLGSTGDIRLNLGYGTLANNPPATAINVGGALAAGATNIVINLSGSGFAVGQFALIDYTGAALPDIANFTLGTLPPGVRATLVHNAANTSIDLNITLVVNALTWIGLVDGKWDIDTTLNWWDPSRNAVVYREYGATDVEGDFVQFDENVDPFNAFTRINLTTTLRPAGVTVNNDGHDYVFEGPGKLSGSGSLTKLGPSQLSISTANDYSGGSLLNVGRVQLGTDSALGTGPVTLGGALVSSDSTTPRALTNDLVISVGAFTLGDLANSGAISFYGQADFTGGALDLTLNSDLMLSGTMANGGVDQKLGPGNLTLLNPTGQMTTGNIQIEEGSVIMNGGNLDKSGGGIRIMSLVPGGQSSFRLLNGGTLTFSGTGQNLRVGSTGPAGDATATNVLDVNGTITWTTNNVNGQVQMGASCAFAQVNLMPGSLLRPGYFAHQGNTTEVNLDGATLAPMASRSDFMQGLTTVNVLGGGVIVDTEGNDITIAQPLLNGGGGGGLTKNGAGALMLNGASTFTGDSLVTAGTLGGSGSLAAPIIVQAGGTLAPGDGLGTLTINNTLDLLGATLVEISKTGAVLANDRVVGISLLTLGGSLTVTASGDELAAGDTFDLFDAGDISGAFDTLVLPDLPAGLQWDHSQLAVDGTLRVAPVSAAKPQFDAPSLSGSQLVLSGTGGTPGGTFFTLSSTNVALPLVNWTPVATNTFGPGGEFSVTNPVTTDELGRYYLLQIP